MICTNKIFEAKVNHVMGVIKNNPSWTYKKVADVCKCSERTVNRYVSFYNFING